MNRWYNEGMYNELLQEYYGHSDFYNYGLWDDHTPDQKAACENLMDRLLSRVPEKNGRILDVACGKGATTAYLRRDFESGNIVGINISEKQLETARHRAPEAEFHLMDATRLEFPDMSFDQVICVEAAFHFDTREKFLEEAFRVLKHGGHLVLSDILLSDWGRQHKLWGIGESNAGLRAEHYEGLCIEKGFSDVEVEDVTRYSWERHVKNLSRFSEEKLLAGQVDVKRYEMVASRIFRLIAHIETYVLVAARKE